MRISFLQYCSFPPAPLVVGSSLIQKVSCYKLLGVHLTDNLTWNKHVTHIVKKGSKQLYVIHALKKCGLTNRQLSLVYCSIIRSVLEYAALLGLASRNTKVITLNQYKRGHKKLSSCL